MFIYVHIIYAICNNRHFIGIYIYNYICSYKYSYRYYRYYYILYHTYIIFIYLYIYKYIYILYFIPYLFYISICIYKYIYILKKCFFSMYYEKKFCSEYKHTIALKAKTILFQKFWQFKLKFPHAIKTTNNSNVMNVN